MSHVVAAGLLGVVIGRAEALACFGVPASHLTCAPLSHSLRCRYVAADMVEKIGSYLSLGQGCAAGCYERGAAAGTCALVGAAVFAMVVGVFVIAAAIILAFFCLVHLLFISINKCANGKFKVACGSRTEDVSPVFGALQVIAMTAIVGLISLFVCLGGDEVACDVAEVCAFIIIVVVKLAFHSSSDDDLFV